MKRVEIAGHAGNSRTVEIAVSGSVAQLDRLDSGNAELAREAARMLHDTLPGYAWDAFVQMVNYLDKHDPYEGL